MKELILVNNSELLPYPTKTGNKEGGSEEAEQHSQVKFQISNIHLNSDMDLYSVHRQVAPESVDPEEEKKLLE